MASGMPTIITRYTGTSVFTTAHRRMKPHRSFDCESGTRAIVASAERADGLW
jgi:hypothetical protein